MAKNKTQKTDLSVIDFINTVAHEGKRKDAFEVLKMMTEITRETQNWKRLFIH